MVLDIIHSPVKEPPEMTLVLNLTKSLVDIKASENGSTSETQREVSKLFRPSKTHIEVELSILTGSMMLY